MADKQEETPSLPGSFLPGIPGAFSFWGSGDSKYPPSAQQLEMRRKIAVALASQKKGFPKNLGEGLTYFGESIGERMQMAKLQAMEDAANAGYEKDRQTYVGGGATPAEGAAAPAASVRPQASLETGGDEAPVTVAARAPVAARPSPATAYLPEAGGGDETPEVVADIPIPAADPVARTVQIAASDPPPPDPANPPYFSNPAHPSLSTGRYPLGTVPPQAFPRQPRLLPGQIAMQRQEAPAEPPPPSNQGLPPVSFDQTFQDTRGGVGVSSSVPPREEVAVADPRDFNEIDARAGQGEPGDASPAARTADAFDALGAPGALATAQVPPPRGDPRDRVALALIAQKEQAQQVAQAQAQQDVMGGYRGAQMPRTASLGREGVVSDAPTPGVTERGVAESAAAREAVTRALLQQQPTAPTPAPAVPSPDPTSGASSPPTTSTPASISEAASTSPVSPSSLQQQLGTFQPPTPAQYAQATIPPARTPGRAPTATDIPQAPVRIPGALEPPTEGPPKPDVGRTSLPGVAVRPLPEPPKALPMTKDERDGTAMMLAHPGDERYKQLGTALIQRGAMARTQQDALNKAIYDRDLKEREAQQKEIIPRTLDQPTTELALRKGEQELADKRQADELRQRLGGIEPKLFETALQKSFENTQHIPGSAMALANARAVIASNPGIFSGAGADAKLAMAKLVQALGIAPNAKITPTEQFKAFVAPITAAARQALVGGTQISNADLNAAAAASGGNINLEASSISGILNSLERLNTASAVGHEKLVNIYAGNDPDRQRMMSSFRLPMDYIIPEGTKQKLYQYENNPAALKEFDETYHQPGLAARLLANRRR